MIFAIFAVAISMAGCDKTPAKGYHYSLDVSDLVEKTYVWQNGISPLVGWQAYEELVPTTELKQNAGKATAGGLYLWATNEIFAIGTRSSGGKDRYLGCIFTNDTGYTVGGLSLISQCVQISAQNTESDLAILEYAIGSKIDSIVDDMLEWQNLAIFYTPVVANLIAGELPAYGNVMTNALPEIAANDCVAFRWRDHSPKSGGNASLAYTIFKLNFQPKTGFSFYLR